MLLITIASPCAIARELEEPMPMLITSTKLILVRNTCTSLAYFSPNVRQSLLRKGELQSFFNNGKGIPSNTSFRDVRCQSWSFADTAFVSDLQQENNIPTKLSVALEYWRAIGAITSLDDALSK